MRNALIMCAPPSSAYRNRLFPERAISVVCAPALWAACAWTSVIRPARSIANLDMESLPALAVYAHLSFLVTTSQHAAAWVVGTAALTVASEPSVSTRYDEAELRAASDTKSWSLRPKSKPNGVAPADAKLLAAPAAPRSPMMNVSRVFVALSVTTRTRPDGENAISAGPVPMSDRDEPSIGVTLACDHVNPAMLLLDELTTYTRSWLVVTLMG